MFFTIVLSSEELTLQNLGSFCSGSSTLGFRNLEGILNFMTRIIPWISDLAWEYLYFHLLLKIFILQLSRFEMQNDLIYRNLVFKWTWTFVVGNKAEFQCSCWWAQEELVCPILPVVWFRCVFLAFLLGFRGLLQCI